MKKSFSESLLAQLTFLSVLVFLSRLPFLWAGFGAEEDSWLLALTAKQIALNDAYQMSRAPGHPLQEILYSFLYNNVLNPFATNLTSAIASVVASLFFALSLHNLGVKHYLFAAFAFAFTPIIFIASTYTIDYMLAMAFVMGSFYFITKLAVSPPFKGGQGDWPLSPPPIRGKGLWGAVAAGIFLGIAIGFRLTSAAMLIPFCILLLSPPYKGTTGGWERSSRGIWLFASITIAVGMLTYLPVLKTYGLSFFHYSDQFPYPNLPKVLYKSTLGVFGAIGLVSIIFFKFRALLKKIRNKTSMIPAEMPKKLFWASTFVIILYIISYLRLPQKSAYLIPVVPFIILMFGYYLSGRSFKLLCALICMSSFLFSINLTDPLRGSSHSALSVKFKTAGQEIFIDPLTGPIFSDYSKRLNKVAYTEMVFQKINQEQNKIVLICGWWYNELLVRQWNTTENPNVIPVFYIDKAAIEKYISEGYAICYLPEQNLYNDQFSQMNYTDSIAKPYFVNLHHE